MANQKEVWVEVIWFIEKDCIYHVPNFSPSGRRHWGSRACNMDAPVKVGQLQVLVTLLGKKETELFQD